MANSKNDGKAAKTMDVVQPGKAAPPTTSRPVIVSNRPILRQDPMMVSSDDMDRAEKQQAPPTVSRVGKTLTVLAPHQAKTAKAPTVTPPSAAGKADATAPGSAALAPKPGAVLQGRTPEEIANKKAITVKTGDAAPERISPTNLAPAQPEASPSTALPSEPTAEVPKSTEQPSPEKTVGRLALTPTPTAPPLQLVSSSAPAASTAPPTTEDDSSAGIDTGEMNTGTEAPAPDSSDRQLAPGKAMDDAKKKADEAEAARIVQEEQIIASKRYYLPIVNTQARRGLARSLVVLLLVLILAAVWFDVILDAGILHVGNIQPLTHFFR